MRMTKYRIVIEFTTSLIDEFIICYVNSLEDVFNFLMKFYEKPELNIVIMKFYDMEPTVVVLDDNHGYDTEKYDF